MREGARRGRSNGRFLRPPCRRHSRASGPAAAGSAVGHERSAGASRFPPPPAAAMATPGAPKELAAGGPPCLPAHRSSGPRSPPLSEPGIPCRPGRATCRLQTRLCPHRAARGEERSDRSPGCPSQSVRKRAQEMTPQAPVSQPARGLRLGG